MSEEKPKVLLSFNQYGKLRGVSRQAVSKRINAGTLSFEIDANGERKINPETAAKEWPELGPTAGPSRVEARRFTLPSGAPLPNEGGRKPNVAKIEKEHYQAKLAKLEFEERSGILIPAEATRRKWIMVAATTRSKILALPSKVRQRLPELTHEQYEVLERIARETCEELQSAGQEIEPEEELDDEIPDFEIEAELNHGES